MCSYVRVNSIGLFDCTLNNINNEFWCPVCVNKIERKLYEQLLQTYPNIISQFRVD
jgi:hypothetical protein